MPRRGSTIAIEVRVYPSYPASKLWGHLKELSRLHREHEGPYHGRKWGEWAPGPKGGAGVAVLESDRVLWLDTAKALGAIAYLDDGLARFLLWRLEDCIPAKPIPRPVEVERYINGMDWRCKEARFDWGRELLWWWLKDDGEIPAEPDCCVTL